MGIELSASDLESRRFGIGIARLDLTGSESAADVIEAVGASDHDLVVVRIPAEAQLHPGMLNRGSCRVSMAELDVTWTGPARRHDVGGDVEAVSEWDPSLADLVHRIFDGYRNHMGRDPDRDVTVVAAGYAEWAERHVGGPSAVCLVSRPAAPIGLAAVRATVDNPDAVTVNLAGVAPEARRQGAYRQLLDAVEDWTLSLGRRTVRIATQADNVAVQRTWARRGWLPERAEWIVHLRPAASLNG